jgi:hypothetical protein
MKYFFVMNQQDKKLYTDLVSAALENMWYYTSFEDELLDIEKRRIQTELKSILQDLNRLKKKVQPRKIPSKKEPKAA